MNDMDAFKELQKRMPDMELMTLDQAHGMVFWAGAASRWVRLQIEMAKKVGGMQEQVNAWIREGQAVGEYELKGQQWLGKIAKETERGDTTPKKHLPPGGGDVPKWQRLGFKSQKAMEQAEFLEAHPKEVKEVIKEAKEENDLPSKGAVRSKVRAKRAEDIAKRAKERAAEVIEKGKAKAVKNVPHGVSEYFEAVKVFRDKLMLTVEGAKRERWFAPESINIVVGKHNEIRELLAELETNI